MKDTSPSIPIIKFIYAHLPFSHWIYSYKLLKKKKKVGRVVYYCVIIHYKNLEMTPLQWQKRLYRYSLFNLNRSLNINDLHADTSLTESKIHPLLRRFEEKKCHHHLFWLSPSSWVSSDVINSCLFQSGFSISANLITINHHFQYVNLITINHIFNRSKITIYDLSHQI